MTDKEEMDLESRVSSPNADNNSAEKSLEKPSEERPALLAQILGGGVSALVQVGLGMVAGYSGVTIPQLTKANSTTTEVFLDEQQVALFSSLVYLAATVGCLIGMLPMVKFGQRITMLMCLPILLLGWIVLAFSKTVLMIQISRCIVGLTIGVIEGASYQYTTEISHCSIRGMMVGVLDTMRQTGILLVYVLGATEMTWQQISLVCGCSTIPPVIIALLFLPNSPRWLVTQGRIEEASRSLAFYRGSHYDITPELKAICNQVEHMSGVKSLTFKKQLLGILEKSTLKIVLFLSFIFLVAQFTGNIVVIAYIVPIFELSDINMNSFLAAMVVGVIRVIATICFLISADYCGRKPALIVSFFTCGISLTVLGIFFYLKRFHEDLHGIDWMPLTSLIFFVFFSCVGYPALHLIRGELLPTTVRSAAMPFLMAVMFGGLFLASQTFPLMTYYLETFGTFWVYGFLCAIVVACTIFVIPETRNENLENITL